MAPLFQQPFMSGGFPSMNRGVTYPDGVGSAANGTPVGGVTQNSTDKVLGTYAWDFDGTDDEVTIPKTSLTDLYDSDCSVAIWFKGDVASLGTVISVGDGNDSTASWMIKISGSGDAYFAAGGTYIGGTGGLNSLRVTTQQFIVVTWSGTTGSLYLNGSGTATVSGTATRSDPASGIHLGARSDGVFFDGTMDEVGFWNRVLTSAEISNLYNSGSGAMINSIDTTGLLAYYNFEQTSGNLINQAIP